MDQPTQERYRPIIERRLAAVESRLADVAPQFATAVSLTVEYAAHSGIQGGAATDSPVVKPLLDERLGMQLALQRIDGGYFGRCIRCGKDLPRVRLEAVPDALTCGHGSECRPRRR